MELLCLTGVEDKLQVNSYTSHFVDRLPDILNSVYKLMVSLGIFLQTDVRPTLELLRNAGVKVRIPCTDTLSYTAHDLDSINF